MTTALGLIAATAVFVWGGWDYFHSKNPSATALVKAVLGLGVIVVLIVCAIT